MKRAAMIAAVIVLLASSGQSNEHGRAQCKVSGEPFSGQAQ